MNMHIKSLPKHKTNETSTVTVVRLGTVSISKSLLGA